MSDKAIEISGIRLATTVSERLIVEAEVGGRWVEVINEYYDGDLNISHIVEVLGIQKAVDQLPPKH